MRFFTDGIPVDHLEGSHRILSGVTKLKVDSNLLGLAAGIANVHDALASPVQKKSRWRDANLGMTAVKHRVEEKDPYALFHLYDFLKEDGGFKQD